MAVPAVRAKSTVAETFVRLRRLTLMLTVPFDSATVLVLATAEKRTAGVRNAAMVGAVLLMVLALSAALVAPAATPVATPR